MAQLQQVWSRLSSRDYCLHSALPVMQEMRSSGDGVMRAQGEVVKASLAKPFSSSAARTATR